MYNLYVIRLYRKTPGDLAIEDVAAPSHPLEDPIEVAMRRLTIFAHARPVKRKPLKADVVLAADGSLYRRVTMTANGPRVSGDCTQD